MTPQTPIAYIPVPISEKPEKEGQYHVIYQDGHYGDKYWDGQEWLYYKSAVFPDPIDKPCKSWLRPVCESETSEGVKKKIVASAQARYGDKSVHSHHEQSCYIAGGAFVHSLLWGEVSTLEQTIVDQDKQLVELGKELERVRELLAKSAQEYNNLYDQAQAWIEEIRKLKHNL